MWPVTSIGGFLPAIFTSSKTKMPINLKALTFRKQRRFKMLPVLTLLHWTFLESRRINLYKCINNNITVLSHENIFSLDNISHLWCDWSRTCKIVLRFPHGSGNNVLWRYSHDSQRVYLQNALSMLSSQFSSEKKHVFFLLRTKLDTLG